MWWNISGCMDSILWICFYQTEFGSQETVSNKKNVYIFKEDFGVVASVASG